MKRREFMNWVGVGTIASFLPVEIAACSSKTQSPPTEEFQAVGTVTELAENGQILNENLPGGAVLVVQHGTDTDTLTAINLTCPHSGCTVNWQPENERFTCPCHGSQFAADGQVIQGPANDPLSTYETKQEGEQILIKAKA